MSSLKDRIRAQRQAHADKQAGMERPYKFASGRTAFRILPGKVDASDFFERIGVHWIKDKKGTVITAVGDREICYGEPCPVRASIEQLKMQATDAGDDDLVKLAKDMLAKERFFANIQVFQAPGDFPKDKAVVAEFPPTAWEAIMAQMEEHLEELADDADITKTGPLALTGGLMFVIEKTGTGLNTKYNVLVTPKTKPVAPASLEAATDLGAFKRSWFDKRTNDALAALQAMTGVDMSAVAGRLAAPQGKALPPAQTTSTGGKTSSASLNAKDADWDDDADEGEGVSEPEVTLDEDDILGDLDNL